VTKNELTLAFHNASKCKCAAAMFWRSVERFCSQK